MSTDTREPGTWPHDPAYYAEADERSAAWVADQTVSAVEIEDVDLFTRVVKEHGIIDSSADANPELFDGFDWLHATGIGEADQQRQLLGSACSGHPRFAEFAELELDEDSDDADIVNELAFVIVADTVKKMRGGR
ncbi:hypothetical protein ACFVAJ_18640 [Agromyces sp. NPDC057679]|uniref:hypothetical protein n=1 Tax=Agromyces sp. NPDC057679 TaxID=3346207 RepID=UPI003672A1D2